MRRVSLLVAGFGLVGSALLAMAIRHERAGRMSHAGASIVTPAPAPAVVAPTIARARRRVATRVLTTTPTARPVSVISRTVEAAVAPSRAPAATVSHRKRPLVSRAAAPVMLSTPVAPHAVEVITVAVPREVPATDTVPWRVVPTGRAEVLSDREGTLMPAPVDSERSVVVVARLPAAAPAGPTHVATAEFDGPDATISVGVNLVVTRVRRADVRLIRAALAVHPADRAQLAAMVTNRGNSTDTLTLDPTLPPGWHLIGAAQTLVLRPGQQQTVEVTAAVPGDAQPTHTYAVLTARASGTALADATADIDVLDRRDRNGRGGPVLTAGIASSVGDSVISSPVMALDLSGNYSQTTSLTGRAAFTTDRENANIQAVGRVGVYLGQAYLSATNPHWQGTVGGTGRQFSPTTGLNAYGVGVSGAATSNGWSGTMMAAAPTAGLSGQLLGAEVGYQLKAGNVSATATDFEERGIYDRALQATGLDFTSAPILGTRLSGGFAWRQFDGGNGMGWSVGANRSTKDDYLSILAAHTPGGTQAYAQATDQVVASGMRRLSDRLAVHAGYTRSSDQNVTFSNLASESWSAGSDVKLAPEQTLDVDLTTDRFDAASSGLGFGSRDVTAQASLRTQIRQFATQFSLTAGQVQRSTTLGAISVDGPAAARLGAAASVDWASARGRFNASASYDYSGPGAGLYPRALQIGVAASGLVISKDPRIPTVDASIQRYEWFGARPGATVARVGAATELGGDYRLLVDVERNPFLQANPQSGTPIVMAVKIERSFGLPLSHRSSNAEGIVYEDINGNGLRDRGEPVLSGVLIRRGGEVATTDEKGRFDLYQEDSRPAAIDATSLPLGMIPGTVTIQSHGLAMGVVPTSPVEIALTPVEDELGRKPTTTNLAPAVVIAQDSAGTVWTIQADSTGHARLDALPPGRYTITVDFSAFTERLRAVGAAPVVEVRAGLPVLPVRLPFGLISVKMFNARNGPPVSLAKDPK